MKKTSLAGPSDARQIFMDDQYVARVLATFDDVTITGPSIRGGLELLAGAGHAHELPVVTEVWLDLSCEGGTAVVFRARDLTHQRWVAIKVFRPELSSAVAECFGSTKRGFQPRPDSWLFRSDR